MIRSVKSFRAPQHMAVLLALCVFLAGCDSIGRNSEVKYPPTDPDSVKIIEVTPYRAFDKVGDVDVRGFEAGDSNGIYKAIREQAASEGADAVIIKEQGVDDSALMGNNLWAKGIAIHFN